MTEQNLVFNRTETAALIGVDKTTLDEMRRRGLPVVAKSGKGVPSEYFMPDVIAWLRKYERDRAVERIERKANPDELEGLKAEKLRLEIEAKEMENARTRGDLADVDEIASLMSAIVIGGRELVRNVAPSRIAQRAAAAPASQLREIAKQEIEHALQDWHDRTIVSEIEGAGGRVKVGFPDGGCPLCDMRKLEGGEA